MKKYLEERTRREKISRVTGVALTLAAHSAILLCGAFTGFKYIYPPPEEKTVLIEFEEVQESDPLRVKTGTQPRAQEVDKTKPIEIVKQSQAQQEGHKQNLAKEATVGEDGDVEVNEPKREKEIDKRALFHAADNVTDKDTLAPQTSSKISESLSAGHADGNSKAGKTTGEPNAKLQGRQLLGSIPSPSYTAQASGTVVVDIWVDNYGNVTKAIPGGEGTTVTNTELWNAARKSAMNTHFSMSADAPASQKGTITYIFKLK
ncbi:MAG: energy transducer TonB [Bacteroidales bacterium]|nr:energy transducer TonB [Bacteroidales bacterium]